LRESIQTNIIETEPFTEYDACIGAGLDVWAWEQSLYPVYFKANVMEWHKFHNMKESHIQDIVAHAPRKKK